MTDKSKYMARLTGTPSRFWEPPKTEQEKKDLGEYWTQILRRKSIEDATPLPKFVCMVDPSPGDLLERLKEFRRTYGGVVQPIYTSFGKKLPSIPDDLEYLVAQPLWTTKLNEPFKKAIEGCAKANTANIEIVWEGLGDE